MASATKNFWVSPYFALNSEYKPHLRIQVRCLASSDSTVLSNDSVGDNGVSTIVEKGIINPSINFGSGNSCSIGRTKKKEENHDVQEKLENLWDDGYGSESVKDSLDIAKEMIVPDGGPPRWFTPLSCGPPLKDSPVLLFLPGMDGVGLGLILHQKAMGKVFQVWCMHIPVYDRTPLEELVKFIEITIRTKHASSPDKPIYVVGDSFGGCLALAVAARNPTIDLVVILANPATSFDRSYLPPLLPLLEAMPEQLHPTVPYLLSLVMGDPIKMASVNIDITIPPKQYLEQLSSNIMSLLPRVPGIADIIPRETFLWKLKLLKSAAAYANSRLHAVKAEVLVIASGKDNLLPSEDEAERLSRSLKNCKIRKYKDNGHTILLENGFSLLTIIKATCTYRRSRMRDYVLDFLPPSASEFKRRDDDTRWYRMLLAPVMFSTMEDGKIVRGLAGIPNEGPVLYVGYHMLMGFDLFPLGEQFLREKKILLRGVAHPSLFTQEVEKETEEYYYYDMLRLSGALPVTATNFFKLFAEKSHVLLYPGGAREALHYKGEAYKLFWPDQPEFVRMAAKFGATIVPFGVVGEDDVAELVLDYNDMIKIPILNDYIRNMNKRFAGVRDGMTGEVANQPLYFPALLPKVPGRFYYKFGKPIQLKGREGISKDKEQAKELYLQIKAEVENSMAYLIKKREEDPFRSVVDRTVYQAFSAPNDQLPAFEP